MTETVVAIAAVLALLALGAGSSAVTLTYLGRKPRKRKAAEEVPSGYLEGLYGRVAALEVKVDGLPSLWEEERERARKHSERAQAAERSARKLREESDEDEDPEFDLDDVREFHANGGGESRMHAVSEGLGIRVDPDLKARAQKALGIFGR